MPLHPMTVDFMKFLQKNSAIRARIKARPGNTLIYAGDWKQPTWREIARLKKAEDSRLQTKEILHEVLEKVMLPGPPPRSLLQHVLDIEKVVPRRPDQFILWRALSGLYAANAEGPVSFLIGGNVTTDKVFAVTELPVLLRNPKVTSDPDMRDILEFCQKCIREKRTEVLVPYLT